MFRLPGIALGTSALLIAGSTAALAQQCPDAHAHVTGTTLEGNVQTVHCGCDSDYVNVGRRCTLRSECIGDAGYHLIFALSDCERNQPSVLSFACLSGIGITVKSLACLTAASSASQNPAHALAACGILTTVPLDAADRCQSITNACLESALQTHKDKVASCQK